MKKLTLKLTAVAVIAIAVFWACKSKNDEASYLPLDVLPSCTISEKEFDAWFVDGKATENGAVAAANSLTFPLAKNCDFYLWSEQMFLWLTSPAGKSFGDGKLVMESPSFYTVSPEDSIGHRTFIRHEKGKLLSAFPGVEKSVGVDSEQGQATGDVLMSKDGAMVYYITMVNDVYAQFLSAAKNKKMGGTEFPTTQAAIDSIAAYVKENKKGVLLDPNTLAMEIKTSWVEASSLKDLSEYIVIDAIIPTYTKTKTEWIIASQTKTKLALIGMHVVGSTAGHPEMIWSTFEHKKVAPNLEYTYLDKDSIVKTRAADTGDDWILNSNSADGTYNVSHMKYKADTIYTNFCGAPAKNTVSPSNTKRTKPWGFANGGVPNRQTATVAEANSQVISINNSIHSLLKGNDLRKNYLFVGSTWTRGGAAPDGTSYSCKNTKDGTAVGGSQLANATMETYIQNGTAYNLNGSCFFCHHDFDSPTPTLLPDQLSHIFNDLEPLYITTPDGTFFNRKVLNLGTLKEDVVNR